MEDKWDRCDGRVERGREYGVGGRRIREENTEFGTVCLRPPCRESRL